MANTTKGMSERDAAQTNTISFIDALGSFQVESQWVAGKVGRLITDVISTTTIANDTITSTYTEGSNTICVIVTVYTDGTRAVRKTATRTA